MLIRVQGAGDRRRQPGHPLPALGCSHQRLTSARGPTLASACLWGCGGCGGGKGDFLLMGEQLLWSTSEPLVSQACIMSPLGLNLKLWRRCLGGSLAHPRVTVVPLGDNGASRKAEGPGTMRNQTWTETPPSSLWLPLSTTVPCSCYEGHLHNTQSLRPKGPPGG